VGICVLVAVAAAMGDRVGFGAPGAPASRSAEHLAARVAMLSAPRRAGAAIFGISEPAAWRTDPPHADPAQIAGLISRLGATSQRFWVYWNAVEPDPPQDGRHHYDFSVFDRMYAADVAAGLRPLLTIQGAPGWARDGGGDPAAASKPPAPSHYADWRAFAAAVARRYPRAIGIEVWNEPNLTTFWGFGDPGLAPSPAAYSNLLAQAYRAIKAERPGTRVIGGALSNNQRSGDGNLSEAAFAAGMFAHGAGRTMDAVSVHPYPHSLDHPLTETSMDQLRVAGLAAGARLPIWVTELGVTTTGPAAVSEGDQARVLTGAVTALANQPDVAAVYVHTLVEPVADPGDPEMGYALTHGSGPAVVPKPVFAALARLAHGGG
jgi:hypothetical protein